MLGFHVDAIVFKINCLKIDINFFKKSKKRLAVKGLKAREFHERFHKRSVCALPVTRHTSNSLAPRRHAAAYLRYSLQCGSNCLSSFTFGWRAGT